MREVAAIHDLVDLVTEKQFAGDASELPYVGLEHIAPRSAVLDRSGSTEGILGICNRFAPGDILFGKLRPNLRKCVQADRKGLCSTEILVLRPRDGHDPRFVAQIVRGEQVFRFAERATEGTKMPRTSWGILSKIRLFAPSSEEQRAIADVLDAVDAAIRETEALIAKLKVLRLGLIDDLLTRGIDDNGELRREEELIGTPAGQRPESWAVSSLGNLLDRPPRNGFSPVEANGETGAFVLGLGCLTTEGFQPIQLKHCPLNAVSSRVSLEDGDVLVSRSNTRDLVGLAGVFRDVGRPCVYPDLMMRLSLKKDSIEPDLILAFLLSPAFRRYIQRRAKGTSGSMVKITAKDICEFVLAVPPPDERVGIIDRVSECSERIDNETRALHKCYALRDGLRDDLLTGRVRVAVAAEAVA